MFSLLFLSLPCWEGIDLVCGISVSEPKGATETGAARFGRWRKSSGVASDTGLLGRDTQRTCLLFFFVFF